MSAPDTNTEKQEKAHKAPLRIGILLPLAFVALIAVIGLLAMFMGGDAPEGAETQVDGRTGDASQTEGGTADPGIPGAAD